MVYQYIVNPMTGRKCSVYSKKGQEIIQRYYNQTAGGCNCNCGCGCVSAKKCSCNCGCQSGKKCTCADCECRKECTCDGCDCGC